MFEDRKRVFVDLFGWDLRVADDRFEIDQFDDNEAVYLLESDQAGRHLGSLRLLRADQPHILGSLFPYLCEEAVPTAPDTREITRLCLSPRLAASQRLHIRNRLISAMVDYGLACGIRTLTGVVGVRFLSQVLAMGWHCSPLGRPQKVGSSTIAAFRIDLDESTPRQLLATGVYIAGMVNEHSANLLSQGTRL
jgi:acyl-homoserine lactone synthase